MTYSHISTNFDTPKIITYNNATLELLKSSVLVSLSGALRIYIACALLRTIPNLMTCVAGWLIIYSVYTLDRTLDSEEDMINRTELNGAKKEIGLIVTIVSFLIGSYILATEGLFIYSLLPFLSGYLYSKGLKIGKFTLKLKAGHGVKNLIVGLMWGIFITGLAGSVCYSIIPILVVFLFFGLKVFVNSTIDDFKDIKGDTQAGVNTLPICLGVKTTTTLLYGLHIGAHIMLLIALLNGTIAFEPVIAVYSLICGLVCIMRYTTEENYVKRKIERTVMKDGEAALIIILMWVADMVL